MKIEKYYEMVNFSSIGINDYFVIPTTPQIKEASEPLPTPEGFYDRNAIYQKVIENGKFIAKVIKGAKNLRNIPDWEMVVKVDIA